MSTGKPSTISVNGGNLGELIRLTIHSSESDVKHTLRFVFGSKSGEIATDVKNYYEWNIPEDLVSEVLSSNKRTGYIIVQTYHNSGLYYGHRQTEFTINIPDSFKPTFDGILLSDVNTAVNSLLGKNTFLQVLSNIRVTFLSAKPTIGATITGYHAEIVGKNQKTDVDGGLLGIMNYTGTVTIRASVTDSRGRRSDIKEVQVNILEYFAPILSFDVRRSGSTSSTLTINRNARIAPVTLNGSQKNNMSLTFKVSEFGLDRFNINYGGATGNWTSINELINSLANLTGDFAANKSWVVVGILEDRFTRSEFSFVVPTESVVFSYDKFGVGVNKVRERGALDVKGESYFSDHITTKHDSPVGHYSRGNSIMNLNDAFTAGIYHFNNNTANQPNNMKTWGMLEVIVSFDPTYNGRDNWIWQTYITTDGQIFKRHRINAGNWTEWRKLAFEIQNQVDPNRIFKREIDLPYGLKAAAIRKGDFVTITIIRNKPLTISRHDYTMAREVIPAGYRPTDEVHFLIFGGMEANTGNSQLHFKSDGSVYITNNINMQRLWTGTISYITNDPNP